MPSDPATKGPSRSIRIGKYEVLSHIATGGMGAVYKARDTETGREVALKVLSPEMASRPGMLERFRREATHAKKLHHENVVTLHEFGEANHTYFLVMEFIDGIDLHEYSSRKGPLDPTEALQIILQACRAIDHAFQQGIIHRDIKPSNFLVSRKGDELVVKMTDLGLARESRNEEFRVTKAGTTVGTLDYMAPEQARDSGLADIRSDLYSLGSTWYHLLAGHAPFPKGGLGERLNRILNEEPADVRKFNPRVSEPTLAVLRRLMAKRPDDRYQKPADLLRDLERLSKGGPILSPNELLANLALEEGEISRPPSSRTLKRVRRSSDGRHTPRSIRNRPRADTDVGKSTVETPLPEETEEPSRVPLRLALAGAVAIIVIVGLLVVLLQPRTPKRDKSNEETPAVVSTPIEPIAVPTIVPSNPTPTPTPVPTKRPDEGTPINPEPKKPKWPALYHPTVAVSADALRKEIEAPWAAAPAPGPTVELVVGRLPLDSSGKTFRSLSAACKAIPAGATGIIELRDNGPFYDVPAAIADRGLILRPAVGFRPLLIWDVQRMLDEHRRNRVRGQPADEIGPLSFLEVKHGNLTLEGLHIALKWPEAPSEGAALLRVEDGDLTLKDCTFSVAGKPRDGVTLARLGATKLEAGRCRLSNCYARGEGLSILDLTAPGAAVLLENCLLVGGDAPLFEVGVSDARPTRMHAMRSTMICGKNLLTVRPVRATDIDPAFAWLGWDVLLSRKSKEVGGELFRLEGGTSTRHMSWKAINCLYAGWETLLSGTPSIPAADMAGWRRVWGRSEGDVAQAEPWPTATFAEPAEVPPRSYHTADSAVAFAASAVGDRLLGCDPDSLPSVRDNWLALTFGRFPIQAPAVPDDPGPPEIPSGGLMYQGEALNLDNIDLGAYLRNVQATRPLGPQVVLHLSGSGERFTSPVRLKGSNLVLYFEPPKEKAEPLVLVPAGKGSEEALIEVEQGNLDILGGTLRITEAREARVMPWLIKMRGGDVRLFRTHLEVPPRTSGSAFRGLIALDGSGDAAAERSRACAVNESVLLSAREGVRIQGIGARVVVAQSLLVAGGDAIHLDLTPGFTGKANVQCTFNRATVAARGSVLHVPDVSLAGPPAEPIVVQTHNCAFLNPFINRGSRPGLVLYDGAALAHGLLVWQSDSDAFDRRIWFASAPAEGPLPNKPEDHASWVALWGTPALYHPTLDLSLLRTLDAERWPLEKFTGLKIPGANLEKLELTRTSAKKAPR